ncbi:similar to Saccharomyces cerevisiae YLR407W Putative protein of unknown function [Maudiozyma barnettii]|uniref:DUF4050 domain-containing protein n=1 Tax=Maudiozyma barnettii TaxID=61262 RepID=A0A8H2ZLJ0_9SACH|nr:hypothetical protein [Kazachstania barnettii]CAB4256177.1 similar to Saccharomyces cerevisiae YLR407W Putative protein of unknown function [Kazachstania barnettii]CAD1784785.1 similar to Saccharomyces cerevisiae YLR407W Putative protein of unknown function [Kazachstania barnettii]
MAHTLDKKSSLRSLNFHLKKKHSNNVGGDDDKNKSSFKQSVSALMNKWKDIFKSITHNTLDELETYSSDEQIDAMFRRNKKDANVVKFNKILNERDSGASLSQCNPVTSSQLEMKLTDERSTENATSVSASNATQVKDIDEEMNSDDNEDEEDETFDNYDDVQACRLLRSEKGEPFVDAIEIWKYRRDLWQKRTTDVTKEDIDERREEFQQIPSEYYDRIYKKLVIEDKPLREPLNLQDALKVINSGWTETKKWERAANGIA